MNVHRLYIPTDRGLTNLELDEYAGRLGIELFRGVVMRDTLPNKPRHRESGIVNLNTSREARCRWVCYYKDGKRRIYFYSFGQVTPMEIQSYLNTKEECERLLSSEIQA